MKYYVCVHKAGHHQVWCNKETHINTYFSCTEKINGIDDITKYAREFNIYNCNCSEFKIEGK